MTFKNRTQSFFGIQKHIFCVISLSGSSCDNYVIQKHSNGLL